MKSIRIALLLALAAITVTACGTAGSSGEATIAAAPPSTAASLSAQVSPAPPSVTPIADVTAVEPPVTATVIVTAVAQPPVTVTAPPPVTVTEQPPPVIVVPDPTTVYSTDYDGQYYSVASLPAGLFCRDLKAMGYSYTDAITYWFDQGQPSNMDIDLNGIPCETVY